MKYMVLTLAQFLVFGLFAQTENVQEFQQKNPEFIFIEKNQLETFDPEFLITHATRIIVFEGDITDGVIAEKIKSIEESSNESIESKKVDQFVKDWLGTHQDVIILTQSHWLSLADEIKQSYVEDRALILTGETITLQDILNYQ